MKKLVFTMLMIFGCSANATVVLNNLSITNSNLSFSVLGTVSQMGSQYKHQLMFGLVDNNDDWMTSFNASGSTFTAGATNSRTISSLYSLGGFWTDSILTIGQTWQIGDVIDITFSFAGVFNVANFNPNNFGMSVGLNTNGNIVPSSLNLVTSSVPEPSSIILLGLGLFGVGVLRNRKAS